MSNANSVYRRVVRRETHPSRSGVAIGTAVVITLAAAWVGVECVLAVLGRPALLAAPADMAAAALALPRSLFTWVVVASGVIVALVGLILLILAIVPGRRGRRHGDTERTAFIVDDRVIATSLAARASAAAGLDQRQVRVTIGPRHAHVQLRPTSGLPVDEDAVRQAVDAAIEHDGLTPRLTARVHIDEQGKVKR